MCFIIEHDIEKVVQIEVQPNFSFLTKIKAKHFFYILTETIKRLKSEIYYVITNYGHIMIALVASNLFMLLA